MKYGNFSLSLQPDMIVDMVKELVMSTIYPIGSIYISINDKNPFELFGIGTWEKIEDRFLLASGKTYLSGDIGGESSHKLTEAEMPKHAHGVTETEAGYHSHNIGTDKDTTYTPNGLCWSVHNSSTGAQYYNGSTSSNGGHTHEISINQTGGDTAHNNMPPYLVVNIWKRIA